MASIPKCSSDRWGHWKLQKERNLSYSMIIKASNSSNVKGGKLTNLATERVYNRFDKTVSSLHGLKCIFLQINISLVFFFQKVHSKYIGCSFTIYRYRAQTYTHTQDYNKICNNPEDEAHIQTALARPFLSLSLIV